MKTQQVDRNRGQRGGNNELGGYLPNVTGPVSLVLDLHLTHERWGSTSDPSITGHLHSSDPNDVDRPLNETDTDKIRTYHVDYHRETDLLKVFRSVL